MGEIDETKPKMLRPKEKRFVEFYLGEAKFNGTKAAKLAGYSANSATAIASENLRKPHIIAYMRELQETEGLNEFQTLAELRDVAYSDWRDHVQVIVDGHGNETAILQLRDKVKALELLAKIQGLTVDRHEVTGKDGGPIATELILPLPDAE